MHEKPNLLLRRELDFSDGELLRARRSGSLQSVRRGAYVRPEEIAQLDSLAQHRLLIEATVDAAKRDHVVSHVSAAIMHGLSLWNPSLARVHLTIDATSGGRVARRRHVHATPTDTSEITVCDGIAVTTVARTVVDFARTESFEKSVVVGDSALHLALVTSAELAAALDSARHRKGAPRAARAIAFMDGRSESVGESRSRVLMHVARLPKPDLQRRIYDSTGLFIGRVDFFVEEFATIGEFDGIGKYTRHLTPGQDAAEVVVDEKLREDDLRATGSAVARWTWQHLATPAVVVGKLQRAFQLGRHA